MMDYFVRYDEMREKLPKQLPLNALGTAMMALVDAASLCQESARWMTAPTRSKGCEKHLLTGLELLEERTELADTYLTAAWEWVGDVTINPTIAKFHGVSKQCLCDAVLVYAQGILCTARACVTAYGPRDKAMEHVIAIRDGKQLPYDYASVIEEIAEAFQEKEKFDREEAKALIDNELRRAATLYKPTVPKGAKPKLSSPRKGTEAYQIVQCYKRGMKDRQSIADKVGCDVDNVSQAKRRYPHLCGGSDEN